MGALLASPNLPYAFSVLSSLPSLVLFPLFPSFPSRNWIWCILAVNCATRWQQFTDIRDKLNCDEILPLRLLLCRKNNIAIITCMVHGDNYTPEGLEHTCTYCNPGYTYGMVLFNAPLSDVTLDAKHWCQREGKGKREIWSVTPPLIHIKWGGEPFWQQPKYIAVEVYFTYNYDSFKL